jgi:hypothetical protein
MLGFEKVEAVELGSLQVGVQTEGPATGARGEASVGHWPWGAASGRLACAMAAVNKTGPRRISLGADAVTVSLAAIVTHR